MITEEQKKIASTEAENIVREYLDSQDEDELREAIFEAILEAIKAQKNGA